MWRESNWGACAMHWRLTFQLGAEVRILFIVFTAPPKSTEQWMNDTGLPFQTNSVHSSSLRLHVNVVLRSTPRKAECETSEYNWNWLTVEEEIQFKFVYNLHTHKARVSLTYTHPLLAPFHSRKCETCNRSTFDVQREDDDDASFAGSTDTKRHIGTRFQNRQMRNDQG